jgi:hypothetical protein
MAFNATLHADKAAKAVKCEFTNLAVATGLTPAPLFQVALEPGSTAFFGQEVWNQANLYQEYRCVGLEVVIPPLPSTSTVIAYAPQAPISGVTTYSDAFELSDVCWQPAGTTVCEKFKLTRKNLKRMMVMPWLHVNSTSGTNQEAREQGVLAIAFSANTTAYGPYLVKSQWEFRGPVPFGEFVDRLSKLVGDAGDTKEEQQDEEDFITGDVATPRDDLRTKEVRAMQALRQRKAPRFPPGIRALPPK